MNQREIKFRAWNSGTKRMVDLQAISPLATELPGLFIPKIEGMELMQYTGLKDKNGREIYEGDIIRSTENDEVLKIGEMLPLSRHLDLLAENIGYYESNKYHLRSAGGQYHLDDWVSNPEFYEVIGNIYENSELLTTSKKGKI